MRSDNVAAIILAAGLSRRMGQPKLVLPWGETTIIGQVVSAVQAGGAQQVIVVTGGAHDSVSAVLQDSGAKLVFNPEHASGEMVSSLKIGLQQASPAVQAALVVLGDQPQILPQIVSQVIAAYRETGTALVVPSYQMRRGHPWLVERSLWPGLLGLQAGETQRDFLKRFEQQIHYVNVDSATILQDLDTPEDYARALASSE